METDDLICKLVQDLRPVQRLAPPHWRMLLWLGLSLLYVALMLLAMGIRPDGASKIREARFLFETGAAFATAIVAALTAFCAACPGWPRAARLAPLAALAAWLGTLAQGIWQARTAIWPAWTTIDQDFVCVPLIVLLGAVPAWLMFVMLRRAAPLWPVETATFASLAAASLAAAGVRLFHGQDACLTVLVWHGGSVLALTILGGALGHWAFSGPSRLAEHVARTDRRSEEGQLEG